MAESNSWNKHEKSQCGALLHLLSISLMQAAGCTPNKERNSEQSESNEISIYTDVVTMVNSPKKHGECE